jgi:hypothetical protein
MTRWLADHPGPLAQDTADAIYRLAAAAGTASELLVRAHACLCALTDDGFRVRAHSLDQPQRDRWHEQRPAQHQHHIARAAAIADRCPDTAEAALIALSAVTRCRYALRHLTVARLSPDAAGTALHGHHITAIPPPLRPPLRAHRTIAAPQTPLLTGLGSGRPNKRSMLECYERYNVPATLRVWLDDHIDPEDGDEALGDDGREILARLPQPTSSTTDKNPSFADIALSQPAANRTPRHKWLGPDWPTTA